MALTLDDYDLWVSQALDTNESCPEWQMFNIYNISSTYDGQLLKWHNNADYDIDDNDTSDYIDMIESIRCALEFQ